MGAILFMAEAVRLPHRLAQCHGGGHRDIDRAQTGPHRDQEPRIGGLMHRVGHAGELAPEQQDVVRPVAVIEIGQVAAVVKRSSRRPSERRQASNAVQEAWRRSVTWSR